MAAMLLPRDGGAQILIDKPILLVGRSEDCDLCLSNYVKVSRRHCCVVHAEDRFLVRDLGSMNGVRVNGSKVLEQELEEGDELAIADAVFVFSSGLSSRPSSQRARGVPAANLPPVSLPPSSGPRYRSEAARSGASSDSHMNLVEV